MKTFQELLGKESPLSKSILDRGFENPSEIQVKSIPSILEGKDVVAGASTGSGKTLAFAAGLVKNVKKDYGVQGLVLTPTRELAEQITQEIADFSKYKNLNVLAIYGGVSIYNQVKLIGSAEIIVATPGRILDHIEKESLDLSRVNTLVIDEADRMFDMGFIDDVKKIIGNIPNKRQTMLFSATISNDIVRLSKNYMKDIVEISAEPHVDPKKLTQIYYDIDDNLKYSFFKQLLEEEKSGLVMIFCNTRRNVDFLANNLKFMGIDAVPIHGGFSQDKRNRFLEDFNSKKVNILIATDVASRGLDIKGVSHVYNYDIPLDKNSYTHRIGRTARAGKEGKVINILSSRDYDNFNEILRTNEFNIERVETPFVKRVRLRWMPEKRDDRNRRRGSMRHEREGGRSREGGRGRERREGGRGRGSSGGGNYGREGGRREGSRDYGRRNSGNGERYNDSGRDGGDRRRDSGRSNIDYGKRDNRGSDHNRRGRDNRREDNRGRRSRY